MDGFKKFINSRGLPGGSILLEDKKTLCKGVVCTRGCLVKVNTVLATSLGDYVTSETSTIHEWTCCAVDCMWKALWEFCN